VSVHAFWCRSPTRANLGDALTPWLIRRIAGHDPVFAPPGDPVLKHVAVGSIIRYAREGSVVWGAGILGRLDPVSPRADIRAVRGPLTRRRALECGASCPEVYGDPALLLPRLHRPSPGLETAEVGVVPHYFHRHRVQARWRPSPGLRLVDVQRPVEEAVDAIAACARVVSSSLHGLIVAHAYGRPALWVEFEDPLLGDGSKFRDYFASLGRVSPEPVRLGYGPFDARSLLAHSFEPPPRLDLEPLWDACPFRP
jgi:pyruvyltransferase